MTNLVVDGCNGHLVQPRTPLPGKPWVWRTMFWDAFPTADLALLNAGFHLAFVDVGNTFGCPDAMKHFDAFHAAMTTHFQLSGKPALEGLSRGGLYAYRWAYVNTDKVGCIYGDAPVCDMKSWPGGKGKGTGSPADWQKAIESYHFASEQQMMEFQGNPIDILAPIAAAHIPILHVCGDADKTVPESENTDIVRTRYLALGGDFALIVKEGCDHHPHGLSNPKPIVDFILSHCTSGETARKARESAPKPGSLMMLAPGEW
jgi:pimeloyl-ACP methyl ester carboxylesterase